MSSAAALPHVSHGPCLDVVEGIAAPRASRSVWMLGAVGAVAFHVMAIWTLVGYLAADEPEDELGSPAIEISLEQTTQRLEPSELPPGPESEAAQATPAVVPQIAKPLDTALPKDVPDETQDPDRVVSPNAKKSPKEETPTPQTVQAAPSQESVAAEATAAPTIDKAKLSKRSTAPAPGTGASARRVRTTWQKQLFAHLDRHKRYPAGAARHNARPTIGFTLDRLGHVVSSRIVQSSGDPAFDAAALDMMRRADPVPPPPPLVADEGLEFTIPVNFRVGAHR